MKRDAILNEIETYMSKINLQQGKLIVENRKSREKKRICSEVSVNSPGNPWSQSRRRNGVTTVLIIKNGTVSKSQNVKDRSRANKYLRKIKVNI